MSQREDETVTVVVPAWNAAATLEVALASVAAQTRLPDAVVVVDDASTDATASIAQSFWSASVTLTVIELDKNGGCAGARAHAIESATTDLIVLLDADDSWRPVHLAELMAARAESGVGIVSPNAQFWDPARGVGRDTYRDVVAVPPVAEQPDDILRRDFVFIGSMFERALYERAGGYRPEFEGAENWDLWIRMIMAGGRVTGVEEPTYLYRVSDSSLSQSPAAPKAAAALFDDVCATIPVGDPRHAIAERTRREMHARLELFLAYEAARAGNASAARRHALAASHGPRAVRARAAALLCAPGAARRWRDRAVRNRRAAAVVR